MRIQKDGAPCDECRLWPSFVRFGGFTGGFHVCERCIATAVARWGGELPAPELGARRPRGRCPSCDTHDGLDGFAVNAAGESVCYSCGFNPRRGVVA